MKKRTFLIMLVVCAVSVLSLGTPLQASDEGQPVVFADFSWDSVQFHNRVAGFILEHGFGKKVVFTMTDGKRHTLSFKDIPHWKSTLGSLGVNWP